MPTIRQPLLARLGKAVSQGAGAFNDYQRGQKLRGLFETSDDPLLNQLSDLVDPISGELSSTGNTLLTNQMAQRRAEAQAEAMMDRMEYTQGQRIDREYLKDIKQAKKDLLPKYKFNPKTGQMDISNAGVFYSQMGIDPATLKPEQIENISDYYTRTGRLPTLSGSRQVGTRERTIPGKGIWGILESFDSDKETPGFFGSKVEDPVMEYEFDY